MYKLVFIRLLLVLLILKLYKMKKYFYVMPSWQNEPLFILHTEKISSNIKKEFPRCTFLPCPFTESDKDIDLITI